MICDVGQLVERGATGQPSLATVAARLEQSNPGTAGRITAILENNNTLLSTPAQVAALL